LLTKTHVFYQDLKGAMEEEANKLGYKLIIQYAEFKGAAQNSDIETFIAQGVDALIVAPCDSSAIAPVIGEAQAKGIPVFTVDIAAHGVEVTSHIASDNVLGGRLIGEYLAKLLNGKGKVAIIDHPEAASVQERTAGFMEALKKFPEMSVVQRAEGTGQRDKAMIATQDVLQAHPDLNAIFGINDDSALGALAAVEAAGKQDSIVIVGYDGIPEAREAILAGKALKADTVQHPKEIGRKTMQIIADHFTKKEVPKVVPVSVDIIDAATLKAEPAK
jgi:ribose transport system substrate-binding protein